MVVLFICVFVSLSSVPGGRSQVSPGGVFKYPHPLSSHGMPPADRILSKRIPGPSPPADFQKSGGVDGHGTGECRPEQICFISYWESY